MTAPWDRPDWPKPHPLRHKFDDYYAERDRRRRRMLADLGGKLVAGLAVGLGLGLGITLWVTLGSLLG